MDSVPSRIYIRNLFLNKLILSIISQLINCTQTSPNNVGCRRQLVPLTTCWLGLRPALTGVTTCRECKHTCMARIGYILCGDSAGRTSTPAGMPQCTYIHTYVRTFVASQTDFLKRLTSFINKQGLTNDLRTYVT